MEQVLSVLSQVCKGKNVYPGFLFRLGRFTDKSWLLLCAALTGACAILFKGCSIMREHE
jgi:hypothetical protein